MNKSDRSWLAWGKLAMVGCLLPGGVLPQNASGGGPGKEPTLDEVNQKADAAALAGHNAWMLTSSALVLFMTAPGLALFYSGLVRKKEETKR